MKIIKIVFRVLLVPIIIAAELAITAVCGWGIGKLILYFTHVDEIDLLACDSSVLETMYLGVIIIVAFVTVCLLLYIIYLLIKEFII